MQVVNVHKAELNKRGIKDFQEWSENKNSLYIGRDMSFFVPGTYASKWQNPYTVKEYGKKSLKLYEKYVRSNKELYNSLHELKGKELGCWCHPDKCHGDVLIALFNEKKLKKNLVKCPCR